MVKKTVRREENNGMISPLITRNNSNDSGDFSYEKARESIDETLREKTTRDLKSILKPPDKGYSDIYRSHCDDALRSLMIETKKYTNHYEKKLSQKMSGHNAHLSADGREEFVTLRENVIGLVKDTKAFVNNAFRLSK